MFKGLSYYLLILAVSLHISCQNGADLIVSACTVSHANLDSYQTKAGRKTGKNTSIPVVHLAELIAFAFGHFPDRLAQLRTRAILIGG